MIDAARAWMIVRMTDSFPVRVDGIVRLRHENGVRAGRKTANGKAAPANENGPRSDPRPVSYLRFAALLFTALASTVLALELPHEVRQRLAPSLRHRVVRAGADAADVAVTLEAV